MTTAPPQGPQFQHGAATHWAVVTWHGINDLADQEFTEVISGDTEDSAERHAHIWGHAALAPETHFTVQYAGHGMIDRRENDPRRPVPLSACHEMNPRQQATYTEAEQRWADYREQVYRRANGLIP